MIKLHKLKLTENGIELDETPLRGVRAYNITHKEGEDTVTLNLVMDATILPNQLDSNFNTFFDKE